jgi:hypothetical protein
VGRALRQAAAGTRGDAAPATTAAPAPAPTRPLPTEELHAVVLLATYPDLLRSDDAIRAGELLIDPALRQAYRAAAEQIGATHRIDVSAWLDAVPADARGAVSAALMEGGIGDVPNPPGQLHKLVVKLELLRVDAEIAMNEKQLDVARARGDEDAVRALIRRGIELKQTKLGLKAALERP